MTRAYLDATAIAKLVCRAPESAALMTFLEDAQEITTSAVSEVEVTRALAPSGFSPADTTATLQSFIVVAVDDGICQRAASLDPPELGALEAVHLATAMAVGTNGLRVVTYDSRLAESARRRGLAVAQPGRSQFSTTASHELGKGRAGP